MAVSQRRIYQIKINLNRAKPPIWRRFLVENTIKLDRFHQVIQVVMGWTDSHMHQFEAGGGLYGMPQPDWDFVEVKDESKVKLNTLLKREKDKINYEYDFGDGWDHTILLEKIFPFDSTITLPQCTKAKGACPPEDIGGIGGYEYFVGVMADPSHPEYEDYADWLGEERFDPSFYDMTEINRTLAKLAVEVQT